MWMAAAACICLAVVAGILIRFWGPTEKNINTLLKTISNDGAVELGTIYTIIEIEGRLANYEQVYVGTDNTLRTSPVSDESTAILKDYIGEMYQNDAVRIYSEITTTCDWYYPVGSNNLKYLIKEANDGTLSLWIFRSFTVRDFTDEEYGAEEKEYFDRHFPGINLSPYTYGYAYKLIYGMESANDIISITTHPSNANNTDFGKRLQEEVGTHTYSDRDDMVVFYESIEKLMCYGDNRWNNYYSIDYRFSYSFSSEGEGIEDKLDSGEETRGIRYLTITLNDGTTIDSLKYDALRGIYFEYGGIISEPLSEDTVYSLNDIWGIK